VELGIVLMKKLLNTKVAVLVRLMLKLTPIQLFIALLLKACFISLQVAAIWLMISWVGGKPLPLVQTLVAHDPSSYIYLAISACALILASVFSFGARWVTLRCVKRAETYVFHRAGKKGGLLASDFRNLSKFLMSIIDAFMPMAFIVSVVIAWIIVVPAALLPLAAVAFFIVFSFKKAVVFSERTFRPGKRVAAPQEYIGSVEHQKFYRILMVPQYISLVTYILIAVGMVIVLASVKQLETESFELGFLPVASALALLQFKSFAVLLVRYGAYYGNAAKVVALLRDT